ncbi:uncharacterized protein LOC115722883 [Cannabis sativa]|uniref:uncharacterized protein LOC115722883 n=1 Tax=Cannabis sativa TaxID=3483 RepID=UPI0029CAAABE|nr:uncharacterized protein LOC115722883 [Cannabis sativa]XP_030508095.2 uncharacterized protein LOC115722883 [Cannabis sativa]
MSCLSQFSSHIEAIFRISHFRARTCWCGAYASSSSSWSNRRVQYSYRITPPHVNLNSSLTSFGARFYSSKKATKSDSSSSSSSGTETTPRRRKLKPEPAMDQEKDAFYVVRKGDVIGVYRNLNDCQAQVGSSICDPPVSVFKGYRLSNDTEEYLTSRGLKDALYTIRADDMKDGIFGTLVQCPLQIPTPSLGETSTKDTSKKRSQLVEGSEDLETMGSTSIDPSRKHPKLDHSNVGKLSTVNCRSCILKFDGASKGNPGRAGAGAVLLSDDGSLICKLREGLGIATNNVAEYRAVLLGLRYAVKKGFNRISVQGDSKLVCMQVQGLWKAKNENMSILCDEVKKLKDRFDSFQIEHVLRGLNSEADAEANLAVDLADGQVQEECAT